MTYLRAFRFGLWLADIVLLELSFYGIYWWRFKTGIFANPVVFTAPEIFIPSLVISAYWSLLFTWFGLYRFDPLDSRDAAIRNSGKAMGFGVLLLFILTFDPGDPLPASRVILASYGFAVLGIVVGNRVVLLTILREFRIRGIGVRKTLLIGSGNRAGLMIRHVRQHPELGFRLRAALTSGGFPAEEKSGLPTVGRYSDIRSVLRKLSIGVVLLAPEPGEERSLFKLVRLLRDSAVRVFTQADQYQTLIGSVRPARFHGHPLIEIRPELLSPVERFLKRMVDILFSFMLLLVTGPFWLLIAALIAIDSRGPVFYAQRRSGRGGREFMMLKFRSMIRGAEEDTGAVWAVKGDPRITRVGKILRAWRLDELPQLLNVLMGHMSLVGPRPERREFVEQFVARVPLYERRMNVKPGLTGWSQVHLSYDTSEEQIPLKLKHDLFYIENMSLPFDMRILFMTLFVVLKGEGQ